MWPLTNNAFTEIDLYRLEQKYARRKNRTTYTTNAQYVDGEYVYPVSPDSMDGPMSANSTGGSGNSSKRRTVFWAPPDQRR